MHAERSAPTTALCELASLDHAPSLKTVCPSVSSGIIIGIVAFSLIVCCLIGKEYRGTHFEEAKTATQIGGGYDNPEDHLGAFKSEKQYSEDIGGKDPHDEYEENVRV